MRMALMLAALLVSAPAAAVDFLGIELGADFTMPECEFNGFTYSLGPTLCWQSDVLIHGRAPLPDGDFETQFQPVYGTYPRGVRSSKVLVVDGKMVAVSVETRGYAYQAELLEALVSKYGKPASTKIETVQNRMGASFDNSTAMWMLDGGVVIYFTGMGSKIDSGGIIVHTPEGMAAMKQRLAAKKAQAARF